MQKKSQKRSYCLCVVLLCCADLLRHTHPHHNSANNIHFFHLYYHRHLSNFRNFEKKIRRDKTRQGKTVTRMGKSDSTVQTHHNTPHDTHVVSLFFCLKDAECLGAVYVFSVIWRALSSGSRAFQEETDSPLARLTRQGRETKNKKYNKSTTYPQKFQML